MDGMPAVPGGMAKGGAPTLLGPAVTEAAIELARSLRTYEVTRALKEAGFNQRRPPPVPDGLSRAAKVAWAMGEMATYMDASNALRYAFSSLELTRASDVLRALDVIGELLWLYEERLADDPEGFGGSHERSRRLRRLLKKQGYDVDDDAVIHPSADVLSAGALASLRDPSAIRSVLRRIEKALPDDPALAIGSAKELIEATAKVVLTERGRAMTGREDLPELVYQAELVLGVHPEVAASGVDGARELRRLLGSLTALTNNVAEMRNKLGTGHGQVVLPEGLRPRHGRLAVGAATAWCSFMLDTLADPEASRRAAPD